MLPVIFKWGSFTLYSYGLMVGIAFLTAILLAIYRSKGSGFQTFEAFEMGVYGAFICLIGSRLLYVLANWSYYSRHLVEILRIWDGGFILYGGLLPLFLLPFFIGHPDVWQALDLFTPSIPLGMALGRIGCFLNGCCWGLISESWGISFPAANQPPVFQQQVREGLIRPDSACTLPVLPTQLYSAAADIGIFLLILRLEKKTRYPGFMFWFFALVYTLVRFTIEIFRYHKPWEMLSTSPPLSLSQTTSLVFAAYAIIMLLVLKQRARRVVSPTQ